MIQTKRLPSQRVVAKIKTFFGNMQSSWSPPPFESVKWASVSPTRDSDKRDFRRLNRGVELKRFPRQTVYREAVLF